MDTFKVIFGLLIVVGCVMGLSLLVTRTGLSQKYPYVKWVLDFLGFVGAIFTPLAGAYVLFYDGAWVIFRTPFEWEDKRALYLGLTQQLILRGLIIVFTVPILLWQITDWGRCPYCRRFPVKKEIDYKAGVGKWTCRKHPQEHGGPVGIHWWSKPQKTKR